LDSTSKKGIDVVADIFLFHDLLLSSAGTDDGTLTASRIKATAVTPESQSFGLARTSVQETMVTTLCATKLQQELPWLQ
jgi:hypothetical protein